MMATCIWYYYPTCVVPAVLGMHAALFVPVAVGVAAVVRRGRWRRLWRCLVGSSLIGVGMGLSLAGIAVLTRPARPAAVPDLTGASWERAVRCFANYDLFRVHVDRFFIVRTAEIWFLLALVPTGVFCCFVGGRTRPKDEPARHRLPVPRESSILAFSWSRDALVPALLYAGMAAIATYPGILLWADHLMSLEGSVHQDAYRSIWHLWWMKKALIALRTNPYFTDYIFYPTGISLVAHEFHPYANLLSFPFQCAFSPAQTFNLLVLLSFVSTPMGMYFLARYVINDRRAAFVAGAFYGFSTYRIEYFPGSLGFAFMEWVPVFVLVFMKAHWQRGWWNVAFGALCLVLAFGAHPVQLVFAALCAMAYWLYLAYHLPARATGLSVRVKTAWHRLCPTGGMRGLSGACLAFLLVLSVHYCTQVAVALAALAVTVMTARALRFASDARAPYRVIGLCCLGVAMLSPILVALALELRGLQGGGAIAALSSADVAGLFVPNPHSTLGRCLGWTTQPLLEYHETSHYLGYAALALGAYGFFHARRRGALFWALCFCGFVAVSLGPHFRFADRTVLPSLWLPHEGMARFLPLVRFSSAPGRFMFGAYLALAILIGFGVRGLNGGTLVCRTRRPEIWQSALAAVALVLVLAEHVSTPLTLHRLRVSPIYRQLAAPGDFTLIDCAFGENMFMQTIHGKKIFGGYQMRVPAEPAAFLAQHHIAATLLRGGPMPTDVETQMRFLRKHRVKYIIDHGDQFQHVLRDVMGLPVRYRDSLVTAYAAASEDS